MYSESGHSSKYFFSLWVLLLLFAGVTDLRAAAPLRPGQPYAEAALCARADVIFCEDFNYPQNFPVTLGSPVSGSWSNPGLRGGKTTSSDQWGLAARQINPDSTYPTKPQGHMPSGSQPDSVWAANWDPAKGAQGDGSTWGTLRLQGENYVNGMAPAKDFYIRFQYYVTSNYAWPGDPKTDKYAYGSPNPVDNKIVFFYPPGGQDNPTYSSYDAGAYASSVWDSANNARYADTLNFRVGDAGDNYKSFPMCSQCGTTNQHNEYGPF